MLIIPIIFSNLTVWSFRNESKLVRQIVLHVRDSLLVVGYPPTTERKGMGKRYIFRVGGRERNTCVGGGAPQTHVPEIRNLPTNICPPDIIHKLERLLH